jgi:hypothetical protein
MKRHVEFEHLELTNFVEEATPIDNTSKSQTMITNANEGCRVMHPTKKHSKVVPSAISIFFGSKPLYKKLDETQTLFMEGIFIINVPKRMV